jgi:hypothetical protein
MRKNHTDAVLQFTGLYACDTDVDIYAGKSHYFVETKDLCIMGTQIIIFEH